MEHARYEAMVEEAIGIKRRTRRDQVQLMLLIKEAKDADVLSSFCGDINLSVAAAGNYLAAFDRFGEMGLVPDGGGEGINEMMQEMWELAYDPTLDGRYGYAGVDNEGIEAAATEAGLKGPTKAKDIAKNPNSMKVAIIGDTKCANAAADALFKRMDEDVELRRRMENEVMSRWDHPRPRPGDPAIHDDDFFKGVFDRAKNAVRRTYDLEDLPEYLLGYAHGRALEIQTVASEMVMVIEARRALNEVNQ